MKINRDVMTPVRDVIFLKSYTGDCDELAKKTVGKTAVYDYLCVKLWLPTWKKVEDNRTSIEMGVKDNTVGNASELMDEIPDGSKKFVGGYLYWANRLVEMVSSKPLFR